MLRDFEMPLYIFLNKALKSNKINYYINKEKIILVLQTEISNYATTCLFLEHSAS